MGIFLSGEGYIRTVTVDDEESTIIIYDNWRQVSSARSPPLSPHLSSLLSPLLPSLLPHKTFYR